MGILSGIFKPRDKPENRVIGGGYTFYMGNSSSGKVVTERSSMSDMGKMAAARLVRTETNYMSNAAGMECYAEAEIDQYIFVATLDLRTSPMCQENDRKTFKVKAAVPGKNMPPLHPWCRSTTRAYLGPDTLKGVQRRAKDPSTGKTYLVPADMAYQQWYDKHVVGQYGQNQAEVMKKKIVNKDGDQSQYQRYKAVLGKDAPRSLAAFQELKYNKLDTWKEMQTFYRQKNGGWLPDSMTLSRWSDNLKGNNWQAVDFAPKKIDDHFERHGADFGVISQEQYSTMAKQLLNGGIKGPIDGFITDQGYVFRYDKDTNSFAVGKPDGVIATFYKPTRGQKYWEKEKKKYGIEK